MRMSSAAEKKIEEVAYWATVVCSSGGLATLFFSIWLSLPLLTIAGLCAIYLTKFAYTERTQRKISEQIRRRPCIDTQKTIHAIAHEENLPEDYVRSLLEHLAMCWGVETGHLREDDRITSSNKKPFRNNHESPSPEFTVEGDGAGILEDALLWDMDWDCSRETRARLDRILAQEGLTVRALCRELYPLFRESRISFGAPLKNKTMQNTPQ